MKLATLTEQGPVGTQGRSRERELDDIIARSSSPVSPVSPVSKQSPEVLSMGGGSNANPYNTASLHTFIKEAFPDAVLLEEHQVGSQPRCAALTE